MENKVTIRDIALQAGVSVATVSYVINNKKGQSISEETAQRVWQFVNLLNYKPSIYAKNLRSAPKSKLIAIYANSTDNTLYNSELFCLMTKLIQSFDNENIGLLLASNNQLKISNADAVISCALSKDDFYLLGKNNFMPIIGCDSLINDPLFFQVTTDYAKLKQTAEEYFNDKYNFVCLQPNDVAIENQIDDIFDNVIFINNITDVLDITNKNILTLNPIISSVLADRCNVLYLDNFITSKADCLVSCVHKALSQKVYKTHFYKA